MKKLLFLFLLMTLALLPALAEGILPTPTPTLVSIEEVFPTPTPTIPIATPTVPVRTPTPATPRPTVSFSLSAEALPDEMAAEAILTLTITNPTGEALREVSLFDPEAGFVPDFSFVDVPAGESVQWTGAWPLTEEEIARRKLTVYGHYRDGKSYDGFSVTVTLTVEPTLLFEDGVITGYTGDLIHLVIPEEIDGQQIVAIGDEAFFEAYELQSVVIPEGVRSIGSEAFFCCYELASVTLPSTLETLGGSAFSYCYSLASIALPEGVTITGSNPFRGSEVQEILLSENHPTLIFADGLLIEKATGKLIHAAGQDECTALVLPEGITEIGSFALENFYELRSVTLPSTLKVIRTSAFFRCDALEMVTLPEGLTTLDGFVFTDCYDLMAVLLPQSLTEISVNPFANCEKLREIYIEQGNPAFVVVDGAFFDQRDGRLLTLQPLLRSVEDSTEWRALQRQGAEWVSPPYIRIIAQEALTTSTTITKVTFSKEVTEICRYACWSNYNLREVVVEGPVTALPEYAFAYCDHLESITLPSTVTVIDENAFKGSPKSLVFICEAGSYAAQWAEDHGYAWHE